MINKLTIRSSFRYDLFIYILLFLKEKNLVLFLALKFQYFAKSLYKTLFLKEINIV